MNRKDAEAQRKPFRSNKGLRGESGKVEAILTITLRLRSE